METRTDYLLSALFDYGEMWRLCALATGCPFWLALGFYATIQRLAYWADRFAAADIPGALD